MYEAGISKVWWGAMVVDSGGMVVEWMLPRRCVGRQ